MTAGQKITRLSDRVMSFKINGRGVRAQQPNFSPVCGGAVTG